MNTPEIPDWLTPGAEVLVYTWGSREKRYRSTTRIARVARLTFTVEGLDHRFSVERQEWSPTTRSTGYASTCHVVPIDSPEARQILLAEQRRTLVSRAQDACVDYRHHPTAVNRLAAIAALQAAPDGES